MSDLTESQQRLLTLLEDRGLDALRTVLETRTRLLRRPYAFEFEEPHKTRSFSPSAAYAVVVGDLDVDENIITAGPSSGALIVLGTLRCRNILSAPDCATYAQAIDVSGLVYAATQDSTLFAAADAKAKVAYSGHGDGWLSVGGSARIDVLDDYVEMRDESQLHVKQPDVRAADLVISELCSNDGGLDRERALALFSKTGKLLMN